MVTSRDGGATVSRRTAQTRPSLVSFRSRESGNCEGMVSTGPETEVRAVVGPFDDRLGDQTGL